MLAYGRKSEVAGKLAVIKSHHGQLRWNMQLAIASGLKHSSSQYIAMGEYRRRWIAHVENFWRRLSTGFHTVERVQNSLIRKLDVGSCQFASEAAQPQILLRDDAFWS